MLALKKEKSTEVQGETTPKNVVVATVAPVEQKADKTEVLKANFEKFKEEPPKTAEDRIQSVKHFEALSTRFSILKDKSNDLKMFEAGNDKIGAKIIFKNTAGFEFEIQNSSVLEILKNAAKNELQILLKEAENEILTFDI